jgi:hypothetical protein
MPDSTISSLPETTLPATTDLLPVVNAGVTKKVTLENLTAGQPIATTINKGLMSAADKVLLTQLGVDVTTLVNAPAVVTVASAATITLPNSGKVDVIVLTGTTTITDVQGVVNYRLYTFHYPSGAGVNLLGNPLVAGQSLLTYFTP